MVFYHQQLLLFSSWRQQLADKKRMSQQLSVKQRVQ
jgi:hypothetical protein